MKSVLALILFLALWCRNGDAQNVAVATASFNTGGITGWIKFYQDTTLEPTNVTIVATLSGLTADTSWSIRLHPVQVSLHCDADYIGDVYDPNCIEPPVVECGILNPELCPVGNLTSRYGMIISNSIVVNDRTGQFRFSGPSDSIIGRSLLLSNSDGQSVCTTIRSAVEEEDPPLPITIYTATFFSPVAGTVYFRQVRDEPVTIYGKLYYINGSSADVGHNWHVHVEKPREGYQVGLYCSDEFIGPHYDPLNARPNGTTTEEYRMFCNQSAPERCELGDFTRKHDKIDIADSPAPYATSAFIYSDTTVQLDGSQRDIIDRSLAIHEADGGPAIIACAPIVASENIYGSDFGKGYLTISQRSPHENTTVRLSENYPDNNPQLGVVRDVFTATGLCPADITPYNPFTITEPNGVTPDQFPLGDIPNKYNINFDGPDTLEVTQLPLYGSTSILGRSVQLITQVENLPVRTCSAFTPTLSAGTNHVLLKGTFSDANDMVNGGIYMTQNVLNNGDRGITNIIVDLYYPSVISTTQGHNWIISSTSCADIDGGATPVIYNPFNVDTDIATYPSECSEFFPLRCQSGDMSGKHGSLKMSSLNSERVTYSFVDPNLQLRGNYTVNGRSLVILAANGGNAVLACSTLVELGFSSPESRINFAMLAEDNFDRVAFVNSVAGVEPLDGTLPPSNILLQQQEVGGLRVPSGMCVTMQMIVIAPNSIIASTYANITQRSLCDRYKDDVCFTQLPNYSVICGADGLRACAIISLSLGLLALFFTQWLQ